MGPPRERTTAAPNRMTLCSGSVARKEGPTDRHLFACCRNRQFCSAVCWAASSSDDAFRGRLSLEPPRRARWRLTSGVGAIRAAPPRRLAPVIARPSAAAPRGGGQDEKLGRQSDEACRGHPQRSRRLRRTNAGVARCGPARDGVAAASVVHGGGRRRVGPPRRARGDGAPPPRRRRRDAFITRRQRRGRVDPSEHLHPSTHAVTPVIPSSLNSGHHPHFLVFVNLCQRPNRCTPLSPYK